MATPPVWEQRFRVPVLFLPEWSPAAPDRCVYASNETGIWQLHAWDASTGERRQVTNSPVGVVDGTPTVDGEGIAWFDDETGDESGRWLVQPFGGGETRPFLEGLPHGWNEGLSQVQGIVAAALSSRDGFTVYVSLDGEPARELCRSSEALQIGSGQRGFVRSGLSADGALLCIEHAEHGDLLHPALRVLDPRSGATVAELVEPGISLQPRCWSPVAGDARLAIDHEREGELRPAVWNPETGERADLHFDDVGAITVEDWWPDGSALLLKHLVEGRHRLLRYDLASGAASQIPSDPGFVWSARVRPDSTVWFAHEQGSRPRRAVDDDGTEVLSVADAATPPARSYESWHFANEHGQDVHGFFVTPDDSGGPFPVLMFVHGGPTSLDMDRWQPDVQAFVDAGFVVGLVNYRGSTGYGTEWRDALIGDIGGPELEDVNAGLRDLVARGLGDPARAVVGGYSWGGYVTLLEVGKHPDLWACGIAGVPVGDYEAAFDDESPLLQAYDRALLGGEPKDLPELMRDPSPIYFVDDVRAPVFFTIGKNDSRCPYQQAMNYIERLAARDHPHEVYVFPTGHSAFDVDERVRQVRSMLEFLDRYMPQS
jgi:dienelactone hydrolase